MTILTGLLLGMFLAALDQTIVATAMRTIADRLDGLTAQAWVTTAYLITSTVTTPLYGKLSDMYGRKPFYMFAITVFVVGSMLCGTAHSIYELAAYRGLQGIGAGGLMSLAFAIVGDIVPPRERGRYQAYFMGVFATLQRPRPGARWLPRRTVDHPRHRRLALDLLHQRADRHHRPGRRLPGPQPAAHPLDGPDRLLRRAVLLTVGIVPLLVVAEKGNAWGWGSATSLAYIIGGLSRSWLFVFWENRTGDDAILPLRFFRNSVFSRHQRDGLPRRCRHVRWPVGDPALPADRQG